MADPGLIRNRLRAEIESARRTSAERRARSAAAARAYEVFLENVAVPVFRMMANILRAEGMSFEAQTPSSAVPTRIGPRPGRCHRDCAGHVRQIRRSRCSSRRKRAAAGCCARSGQ